MKKIDPNEPSMPIQYDEEYGDNGRKINRIFEGLTIRQYYAGLAMAALIGNNFSPSGFQNGDEKGLSEVAVKCSDALINELNKESQK